MTLMSRLTITSALVSLMGSTAALADITADDVWDTFTTYYQSVGLTLEATQSRAGDRLNIENLKLSGDFPFDLGNITVTTGGFSMTDNADGTVSMQMPDSLPIALALTLPDDIFVTANLDYIVTRHSAVVSGNPDDFTIDYAMDTMGLTLTHLSAPDLPDGSASGSYTIRDISGKTTYKTGDLFSVSQQFTSGAMELEGKLTDVKGDGEFRVTGIFDGMGTTSQAMVPASGLSLFNLPDLFRSGLSLRATTTMDNLRTQTIVTQDGQILTSQIDTFENSDSTISISQSGFAMSGSQQNRTMEMTMKFVPFPLRFASTNSEAAMNLPFLSAPDEQDFGLAFAMDGLTMNDEVWTMFDPQNGLPRDPANMALDVSGSGRLFFDLVDIEAMTKVVEEGLKFGELTSLAVNDLQLSTLDTSLTGKGAFSFDNNNLETFNGFPAPFGDITFTILGANTLMDRLVEIGLLQQDDVMGARMMMGLFAVVEEGEDSLTSKIEINEQGHVLANGQRLQ